MIKSSSFAGDAIAGNINSTDLSALAILLGKKKTECMHVANEFMLIFLSMPLYFLV